MENLFIAGFLLMFIGGAFEGIFSFPLKYTHQWAWENTWGAGSLMALLLLPWPLSILLLPDLSEIYGSVSPGIIILAVLFGIGWGAGGIFFGKGLAEIGFSIGMAIIMGVIAIGGSIIPLSVNKPEALLSQSGLVLLLGVLVMIIGLTVTAKAGLLKEKDQIIDEQDVAGGKNEKNFRKGLLFCILAGVLSSLVNFGFIYGGAVSSAAIQHGAQPIYAENALLSLVLTANFLVNITYCIFLLFRNKTFQNYKLPGTGKYWLLVAIMGILWPGGIVVYGMGISLIGDLGAYLGFPVMMIVSIVIANIFGVLTGEWSGVALKAKRLVFLGITILVLAIVVLGISINLA